MSSPVKRALRSYASGEHKSIRAAARAHGISVNWLNIMSNTTGGQSVINETMDLVRDKSISVEALIERLGRRGIEVIANTMENAKSDELRFKAAQDLADRAPKTSKTQKIQSDAPVIAGRDLRMLAEALVVGASLKERYAEAAQGNYVRVDTGEDLNGTPDSQTPRLGNPVRVVGEQRTDGGDNREVDSQLAGGPSNQGSGDAS